MLFLVAALDSRHGTRGRNSAAHTQELAMPTLIVITSLVEVAAATYVLFPQQVEKILTCWFIFAAMQF